jgi:hypothetical protein
LILDAGGGYSVSNIEREMMMQNEKDQLSVEVGKFFKASASGRYTTTLLLLSLMAGAVGRLMGFW